MGAPALLHLAAGHHAVRWPFAAAISIDAAVRAHGRRRVNAPAGAAYMRMSRRSSPSVISYRLVIGGLSSLALSSSFCRWSSCSSPRSPTRCRSSSPARVLFALVPRGLRPGEIGADHTAALSNLIVAASATAVSACSTLAALAIAGRRSWWAQALDAIFMSPLILPTLAFGLAALMFFSTLGLPLSIPLMIVGHVAVTMPFILRTTTASLSQLDRGLLDTSASLGAGAFYTFRRVTLPVIRPGILAGAFIAFMASLDNVSVSLFLAGPETDVLPIRMWSMLESTLDVRTAAVSGVLIATTALFVFVMDRVAGLTRRLT